MNKRLLAWTLSVTVGGLLLIALLWSIARFGGLSSRQQEALDVMQFPPAQGENAFPWMWLLEYDVPEQDIARVLAADTRRFSRQPISFDGNYDGWAETSAGNDYAFIGLEGEQTQLMCRSGTSDCLNHIRQNQQAVADLVDDKQRLLHRLDELRSTDHYRSGFPPRFDMPKPAFQLGFFPATRHALWFVEGRTDEALAGVCQDIATWRRLAANGDSLIVQMIGIAYSSDANARLLAQMLSELPPDHTMPQECDLALAAPAEQELSLCNALRGEYAMVAASTDFILGPNQDAFLHRMLEPLVVNRETIRVDQALALAPACSDPIQQAVAADHRDVSFSHVQTSLLRWSCADNLVGCLLMSTASPDYNGYLARVQDHGARLRLLSTLVWLRGQAAQEGGFQEQLAQRPDWMKSASREVSLGPDGKTLQVEMFGSSRDDVFRLPLPAALYQ